MDDLPETLKTLILEKNQLDWELYQYCLEKFERIKTSYNQTAFTFKKDKYNHVIPYASQCCYFEFSVQNKQYLQQNLLFFRDLTFYLLKTLEIDSGKQFSHLWNESYKNAINDQFPNSSLNKQLQLLKTNDTDPMQLSFDIAACIDSFLAQAPNVAAQKIPSLQFQASHVVQPKIGQTNKRGFFGKLFGRK
jgi:hypothetical protein